MILTGGCTIGYYKMKEKSINKIWYAWYILKALVFVIKNGFALKEAEREINDLLREDRVRRKLNMRVNR